MAEQQGSNLVIARLEKGNKERTAQHADVMNEIIDRLNALANATVVRAKAGSSKPSGRFMVSDGNMVLNLKDGLGIPDPPATGTYVLGAIDADIQWIATETCPCGPATVDGGSA